jgi:ADP-ribose pyrophosphatase
MHLFLAQDIHPGTAAPEEDEQIRVRLFSMGQLLRMIHSGRIKDGKSIVGLLYWAQWGANGSARRK